MCLSATASIIIGMSASHAADDGNLAGVLWYGLLFGMNVLCLSVMLLKK